MPPQVGVIALSVGLFFWALGPLHADGPFPHPGVAMLAVAIFLLALCRWTDDYPGDEE